MGSFLRRALAFRSRQGRLVRSGPNVHGDRAQGNAVRREGVQWMQESAASLAAVHRAGPDDLLLRPREIQLRRVLRKITTGCSATRRRAASMCGWKTSSKPKPLVLEQTIRRRHLGIPAACRGDARRGLPRQLREHDGQPFVQSLVGKVCGLHFLTRPGSQHVGTPLPEFAPLRQFSIPRLSPIRGNPPRSMRTCVEQQAVNGPDNRIVLLRLQPGVNAGPKTSTV